MSPIDCPPWHTCSPPSLPVTSWATSHGAVHDTCESAIDLVSHHTVPAMIRSMLSRDSLSSLKSEVGGESSGHKMRRHIMAKQHSKPPSRREAKYSRREYVVEWPRLRALQGAAHLLQRVDVVQVQHSIRRHVHRYYAMRVFLQSHRGLFGHCDADYVVEHAHGALMGLRDSIAKYSEAHAKKCQKCKRRFEYLDEHSEHTRRVLSSWKDREQRIESLLLTLVRLVVEPDQVVRLGACEGCDNSILDLARFLRQQYQPSTGIL